MRSASASLAQAVDVVERVVAKVGLFTEATLVNTLVTALESGNSQALTAYGVHIGNLNVALADRRYRDVLAEADYLYADGTSTLLVRQALGRKVPERIVTTDLIWPILRAAALGDHPVFFLGGPDGLAAAAAEIAIRRVPNLRVSGTGNGFFAAGEGSTVAAGIAAVGTHLLIACMGVPREQYFCSEYGTMTKARLLMTAGGLYGYIVANESRAPMWMRRYGLEWLFRLIQSPRRLFLRYAEGVVTTCRLLLAARSVRRRRKG